MVRFILTLTFLVFANCGAFAQAPTRVMSGDAATSGPHAVLWEARDAGLFEKNGRQSFSPYATASGMRFVLDQVAVRDPRAKNFSPETFMDLRFVKPLEAASSRGSIPRASSVCVVSEHANLTRSRIGAAIDQAADIEQ